VAARPVALGERDARVVAVAAREGTAVVVGPQGLPALHAPGARATQGRRAGAVRARRRCGATPPGARALDPARRAGTPGQRGHAACGRRTVRRTPADRGGDRATTAAPALGVSHPSGGRGSPGGRGPVSPPRQRSAGASSGVLAVSTT